MAISGSGGKLKGRVALVTGAGRGIGLSLVCRLAAEGACIVINDLDESACADAARQAASHGADVLAVAGSVTADDFAESIVKTTIDRFGTFDILINNAGYIWNGPIATTTDAQWDAMQAVHLKAPFRLCRAWDAPLRQSVADERARGRVVQRKVVNVSSLSATLGAFGQIAYSSAKAGLIGMTRSLAKEWGPLNVNVNCVAFGLIQTRLTQEVTAPTTINVAGQDFRVGLKAKSLERVVEGTSLHRAGTPDEAAGAIMLFCFDEANYITGECLEVSGGLRPSI